MQEWITWLRTPAYTTIRQWLLKMGLYKLERPKSSPNGWFFIIDTSIQMGPQKVVVILGVKKLNSNQNFHPNFEEVEPLVLAPLYNCPGVVINELLEKAITAVGVPPIAIISDQGSELKKGARLFSEKHPTTIHLFDISHKINSCLKKELSSDSVWLALKTSSSEAIQKLKLSPAAYLAPPKQRTKDRMHSAFPLIDWAVKLLKLINTRKIDDLNLEEKNKVNWIQKYQFDLPYLAQLKEMSKIALDVVHEQGYHRNIGDEYLKRVTHINLIEKRSIEFCKKIKNLLDEEGKKVPETERYLGSSEVIESLFGKFKALEDNHALLA